ncbi:MAG: hypothetical protein ABI091_26150, partial [Ferruginibacter sp.]
MKQYTNLMILMALFSTIIFNGCKKNNSDAIKNCRIITVSYAGGIVYNFTYTGNGKLSTVTNGSYATNFDYYTNHVVST